MLPIEMEKNNRIPELNEGTSLNSQSIKDIFLKYLHHLPFVIFCVVLAYGISYIIIRYTEPVYNAEVQLLVKIPELSSSPKNVNSGTLDLVEEALNENKRFNMEVEMTRLKSIKFLKRVVEKGNFQVKVRNLGRFRSATLFLESPITELNFKLIDSNNSVYFFIDKIENNTIFFTPKKNPRGTPSQIKVGQTFKLFNGDAIRLDNKQYSNINFEFPLEISYRPSYDVARQISNSLSVAQVGKTSVLSLSLRSDNPVIAKEFLDHLVQEYQVVDIESKRKASRDAIVFINERQKEVANEISQLSDEILVQKKNNKFYDAQEGASYRSKQIEGLYFRKTELETRRALIQLLKKYISNRENNKRTVPTLLGLENSTLNLAINRYNEVQLSYERDKEQLTDSESNRFVADYEKRVADLRYNLVEILNNIDKELEVGIQVLDKNENYHALELNKIPEYLKAIENLTSQLNIKKALYTYLIQRREQLAITSSSVQTSYEAIDKASAGSIPIEPKVENIRNFALLSGLIFGIVVIYLLELFNDKIISREQLQKKLKLPIAGEIAHTDQADRFVFKKSRSLIAEQFRMVRANLPYLLKTEDTHKVILITSTIPGEGKSFVSSNLAASLSLVNKKVALLLFDLRKINSVPAINELMEQTRLQRGITNYLIGQVDNPDQIHLDHPDFPNLHVFPSGPIPPNPAELLLNPKVKELFDYLRTAYDYVIVDTAPSALVSDCFILQEYADITLYLIRQRYTLLKQMDYIREIAESNRLKNMTLLVNDVVAGGRYGYYGYTYTYGYGYTYNYNYTYSTKYLNNQYYTESIKLSWLNRFIGFVSRLMRRMK
ncbi:MAG: polysaccharide biosynthesis tyrosine autokinase [Hydrotalea sp.]|nr:polysaccharide biosynthesis tyrosine autokinase [Hydrotalea sp.]